jgi:hypothetical protein
VVELVRGVVAWWLVVVSGRVSLEWVGGGGGGCWKNLLSNILKYFFLILN